MESLSNRITKTRVQQWIAIALCAAMIAAWALEQFVFNRSSDFPKTAPNWTIIVAALIAAASMLLNDRSRWLRLQRTLLWSGLLLMVWTANGILFDLSAMAGLIRNPETGLSVNVNWLGFAIRMLAITITVILARFALARPTTHEFTRAAAWYGYIAFVLALPYPVLWTYWALGGKLGLTRPDAAVHQIFISPFIIPWILAAALSLLLVSTSGWKPRRFLLVSGWSATAIVATVGPGAFWLVISKLLEGGGLEIKEAGIAGWVPCLFYSSWFFWAIAAGAATRSYQLRSAKSTAILEGVTNTSEVFLDK